MPDEFDYRLLLLKYIAHVGEAEGVDFIRRIPPFDPIPYLSESEQRELGRLSEESETHYDPETKSYRFPA